MPLHCVVIGPKFLNVFIYLFQNPILAIFSRIEIMILTVCLLILIHSILVLASS